MKSINVFTDLAKRESNVEIFHPQLLDGDVIEPPTFIIGRSIR